jgi:hypothetical protein
MQKITVINVETGEITERDETPEEVASREESTRQEAEALTVRQSALAKLEKLGLTEDEINAIIS